MLVLSRKIGEKIIIDNNISLTVIDVSHGKVRLGIDAPKNISIQREEIVDRESKKNKEITKR